MKKTLLNSITVLTLATTVIGVTLIGCKDTDYPTPQPSTTGFLTSARVLIANASDAAGITALLENVSAGGTLTPGTSTTYVNAPVSVLDQIRIKGVGGTFGATDLTTKILIAPNTNYTVFVTDTINRPQVVNALSRAVTDVGGARILPVTDPLTQTLTAGSGGVRFFHLAPDAGLGLPASTTATTPSAVSVRLTNLGSTTATALTPFNGRTYRTVSANAFTSVPAGTYRVDVVTGSTVAATGTISPIASSTVTVEATKLYTLYAQGLARRRTLSIGRIQHN